MGAGERQAGALQLQAIHHLGCVQTTIWANRVGTDRHNATMPRVVAAIRSRRRLPSKVSADASALSTALAASGYTDACVLQNQMCALKAFPFTTAVVVGVDLIGYERRYCYEHRADAQAALAAWDGHGHPSGPWIKCKGTGIDLFNPEYR